LLLLLLLLLLLVLLLLLPLLLFLLLLLLLLLLSIIREGVGQKAPPALPEAVDSLEVRMATQRASALATLEVPAGAPRSAADGAEPGEPLCRRWPCDGAFDRGGQHTAVVSILAPEENEQCGCASTGSAAAAARPAGGAPARLL
ncbi:unnamed protein product, partial [Prorocentrum cordatum]